MAHDLLGFGDEMVDGPYVSVVLPTRDRADVLTKAVQALLASTFDDFDVVVVDQSHDDVTAARIQRTIAGHATVRLVRDPGTGSSHARNVGIAASSGEIVAFTDDDCEVAPDWLAQIAAAFRAHTEVGAACGAVIPAAHDARAGFIVGYQPRQPERLTGRMAKLRDAGIGANMSFRRRALEAVGGWDELLGAGSHFEGAGDRDLLYRVLGASYPILQLPDARVTHYGFRDWRTGGRLMRGRFEGIGAAYGKHLRLGDPIAGLLLLQELSMGTANVARSIVTARRPVGVGRLWGLLNGFVASFGHQIDASTKRYVVPKVELDPLSHSHPANGQQVPDRRAGGVEVHQDLLERRVS